MGKPTLGGDAARSRTAYSRWVSINPPDPEPSGGWEKRGAELIGLLAGGLLTNGLWDTFGWPLAIPACVLWLLAIMVIRLRKAAPGAKVVLWALAGIGAGGVAVALVYAGGTRALLAGVGALLWEVQRLHRFPHERRLILPAVYVAFTSAFVLMAMGAGVLADANRLGSFFVGFGLPPALSALAKLMPEGAGSSSGSAYPRH